MTGLGAARAACAAHSADETQRVTLSACSRPEKSVAQVYGRADTPALAIRCRLDLSEASAEGLLMNRKRVDRLNAQEGLQVRRRKHKKITVADRRPLGHPSAANRVLSIDFAFDRTADGHVVKYLTIVDDVTHEAVAIAADHGVRQGGNAHSGPSSVGSRPASGDPNR